MQAGAHGVCSVRLALLLVLVALALAPAQGFCATAHPSEDPPLKLQPNAVLATGNNWIALPEIRANDGAIVSFNVLSMRERGLLQVQGSGTLSSGPGQTVIPEQKRIPAVAPWVSVGAGSGSLHISSWRLIDYWIPVASAHAMSDRCM